MGERPRDAHPTRFKFDAKTLAALPSPEDKKKPVEYWDRGCPGLHIRAGYGGARAFRFAYFVKGTEGGKGARVTTLGRFDKDYPLAEARRRAKEISAAAGQGRDLIAEEQQQRENEQTARRQEQAAQRQQVEVHSKLLLSNQFEEFMLDQAKNRTAKETRRCFERYILPELGHRPVTEIKRSEIRALLKKIQHGQIRYVNKWGKERLIGAPVQADRVLAHISKFFSWYRLGDDDFNSPIVRGMACTSPKERERERTLSPEEIAIIWPLLDEFDVYGKVLKGLFLSAQRLNDVAQMRRPELGSDDIWGIPGERYKTKKPHFVPLSSALKALIAGQDTIGECEYVFTIDGEVPINGFSKWKAQLDVRIARLSEPAAFARPGKTIQPCRRVNADHHEIEIVATGHKPFRPSDRQRVIGICHDGVWGYARITKVLTEAQQPTDRVLARVFVPFASREPSALWLFGMQPWRHHDLRRTGKTLMQSVGVSDELCERVLGHVLNGVSGTYGRHSFQDEKRQALEKLAARINEIVGPPPAGNVVPLRSVQPSPAA